MFTSKNVEFGLTNLIEIYNLVSGSSGSTSVCLPVLHLYEIHVLKLKKLCVIPQDISQYLVLFTGGKTAPGARPDPVREECDIPVKIADLGNACWTVSLFKLSFGVENLIVS